MRPASLTERRAADRRLMSTEVSRITTRHGGQAEVTVDGWRGKRSTHVDIAHPSGLCLGFSFNGKSCHKEPDTYVLAWHMRGTDSPRMNPAAFHFQVNPHHGMKATVVCLGWEQLSLHLQSVLTAAADGWAFLEEPACT